jgi:protein-disulfide isomerase
MKNFLLAIIFLMLPNLSFATTTNEILTLKPDDYFLGDPNAKVTIIEYSSLTCPHCAHLHKEVFKQIKSNYIDKGLVKYIYRDFPINKPALKASILAHCAGKDKYFDFISTLFESQNVWAFNQDFEQSLSNIATLGGINNETYTKCSTDKSLEDKILSRAMEASKILDINATPVIFINGNKIDSARPYSVYQQEIDKLLKK